MSSRHIPRSADGGVSPDDCVALLGNDPGVEVLWVQRAAFKSGDCEKTVACSDLIDPVDSTDSGNVCDPVANLPESSAQPGMAAKPTAGDDRRA